MAAEACDSLAKFLEEGKLELLQKAESQFEVAKKSDHRFRIIAVVGLFDKGAQFRDLPGRGMGVGCVAQPGTNPRGCVTLGGGCLRTTQGGCATGLFENNPQGC